VPDDNGEGLRAFFYGLCRFHGIYVQDPEVAGEAAADFYLSGRELGLYVLILPKPEDRPVEVAALRDHQVRFVMLNREDLALLRTLSNRTLFIRQFGYWTEYQTQCDVARRRAGIE